MANTSKTAEVIMGSDAASAGREKHATSSSASATGAVFAIVACVFLPTVGYDFVSLDDSHYVYENSTVLQGLSFAGVRRAFTEITLCNWTPLVTLSYQADVSLFGPKPWGFHLTNVLLHAGTTAALYLALVRLTTDGPASTAAALLYGIHPQRAESVAWISDRKDLLAGLFIVLALLAYERYCRRPSWQRYAGVAAAMLASLLAKATAIMLPILLLLCDVWPLRRARGLGDVAHATTPAGGCPPRSAATLLLEKLPLLGLAAVFAVITIRTHDIDKPHMLQTTAGARVVDAWKNLAWYVEKTVAPIGLHPEQHWQVEDTWRGGVAIVLVLAAAAFLVAVVARRRHVRWSPAAAAAAWGCAWFVAASLPILGLTSQIGSSPHTDRYMYVPHMGLAVAAVWSVMAAWQRLRQRVDARWRAAVGWGGCSAAVAICLVATERQLTIWRNTTALASAVLRVDPGNPIALTQLASQKMLAGDFITAEKILKQLTATVLDYPPALTKLAEVYVRTGRPDEALAYRDWVARVDKAGFRIEYLDQLPEFQYLLRQRSAAAAQDTRAKPQDPAATAEFRAGIAAAKRRDFRDALRAFQAAVDVDPGYASAHNNLGMAAVELGDVGTAEKAFRRAVQLAPAKPDFMVNLVRLLMLQNRVEEALPICETAARLAPHDMEIPLLLDRLRKNAGSPP